MRRLLLCVVATFTLAHGGCATAVFVSWVDAPPAFVPPERVRLAPEGPPYRVLVVYADRSSAGMTWSPGATRGPATSLPHVAWGEPEPGSATWSDVHHGPVTDGWSWADGELTYSRGGRVTARVSLAGPADATSPRAALLVAPLAMAVDLATLPLQVALVLYVLVFGLNEAM